MALPTSCSSRWTNCRNNFEQPWLAPQGWRQDARILHRHAGGSCSEAAGASHPLSRRIRATAPRAQITPARRGNAIASRRNTRRASRRHEPLPRGSKRVFNIDIETCEHCGGTVKIIASIEDPAVIKTILDHLEKNTAQTPATHALPPAARAPPQTSHLCPTDSALLLTRCSPTAVLPDGRRFSGVDSSGKTVYTSYMPYADISVLAAGIFGRVVGGVRVIRRRRSTCTVSKETIP